MTDRRFWWTLAAIVLLAAILRGLFPAADPPWRSTVGVVWHDEGAWTHNARNKALYGAWVQDQWNPVYVAPVFTGLEYAAFEAFGVGLRQARLVSELAGLLSVLLLALGVRRIAGNPAGLFAGALLATNYVYVMYDRAAIMEAPMTAFIVASWYSVARAERQPQWGALAGLFAAFAFFTKAAAAAYVGALGLAVILDLSRKENLPPKGGSYLLNAVVPAFRRNLWLLGGLAISFGVIGLFFVMPHWSDYRFYNWQMSVTRKPSYDLHSLVTRVTWFPILHDTFSRMWGALCFGVLGAWSVARGWRRAGEAERLLLLWVCVGVLELLVHDVGNERRFVFLIPALVALASLVLARGAVFGEDLRTVRRAHVIVLAPIVGYSAYVLLGPVVRLPYLADVYAGLLKKPVRVSAAGAVVLTAALVALWPRVSRLLSMRWTPRVAATLAMLGVCWNIAQFASWAAHRTYKNYQASVELGRVLPPDTRVQGKLANGLALENRIRPIFIGHEFGNYADRKQRWDVRYILTYTDPEIGHEGDQIVDVLAAYPGWRIIMTFPVAETPSGHDTAALIEKRARD
jgi:4-amino-4-deoxy-L-arabinose transferase-like glycosyltransferase